MEGIKGQALSYTDMQKIIFAKDTANAPSFKCKLYFFFMTVILSVTQDFPTNVYCFSQATLVQGLVQKIMRGTVQKIKRNIGERILFVTISSLHFVTSLQLFYTILQHLQGISNQPCSVVCMLTSVCWPTLSNPTFSPSCSVPIPYLRNGLFDADQAVFLLEHLHLRISMLREAELGHSL